MPKKRTHNFKHLQSSSTATASRQYGASGPSDSPSVNERLSALRQIETPEGLQKKRDLADSVNQPSVPPELRGILGVLESEPPKPKPGVRMREMRRTPGPAPPKSWLGYRSEWWSTLVPCGLLHLTLKRLAEQWDLFDEVDFPALVDVPLRLRLRLLSYMGFYGPLIDTTDVQALTSGDEPITHLDLAGLAGHGALTTKRLVRLFEASANTTTNASDAIADSWDAEETLESILTPSLTAPRFNTLTHLSLSNPPPTASWRDLLALSKSVSRLTHLSLAYWPRPTLTPNLTTATVSSRHSPEVRAGGSHYYSTLDNDYAEAAALLRQLSHHLLCMKWLDLEGCADWVPALGTLNAGAHSDVPHDDASGWSPANSPVITIFAHTWKNLTYIRCAQGWLPSLTGLRDTDRSLAPDFKALLAKQAHHFPPPLSSDLYEVDKRRGQIWLDNEQKLIATGHRINNIRRARSCRPVTMDFGWCQKAV
ncbi:hypothetical protein LTR91_014465 [Friedmanniomyces endolithicus]|uniref:Uncharacterized protein n=1 Tax=Friedmanniomyces endolithicus TaxID=329885 RepID=A0AAN6FS67_9PEZI|nr:hypothetical protein LTR35_008432 [Friedmanniomyces endolithicus]KAK0294817.1 hypothetical protein LTS00_006652 [Friedmanniomyces endolithicus]KAK0322517.1 hypothetical protein LTR82_006476 [Friedmanniomyces endolithicus]KAK0926434.1 hypothetical protein LTR57_004291 [Friedmanniomyces endolithicus]KAK0969922.1 hypothetical protein LTS01_016048 [Friedmanniomyces endolithicus]